MICFLVQNHHQAVALLHRNGYCFAQPLIRKRARQLELVDDDLDIVVLVAIHLHASGDVQQFTIDTDIEVSLAAHTLEKFAVMTFSVADEWGKDIDGAFLVVVLNHLHHLFLRVSHHLFARHIAVGCSSPCKQQSQVVVDFSGGTHC